MKIPLETFRGGHCACLSDPGDHREIARGPMFGFTEHGDPRIKA